MSGNKDYRVEVRIKNALLLRAIEEEGFRSVKEFSVHAGVNHSTVYALIGMRLPALKPDGEWSDRALRIAETLNRPLDELFNERQAGAHIKTNKITRDVSESEIAQIAAPTGSPERAVLINDCVDTTLLNPKMKDREFEILTKYYGLHDRVPRTLPELAEEYGISANRVKQIRDTALRRSREHLRDKGFFDDPDLATQTFAESV